MGMGKMDELEKWSEGLGGGKEKEWGRARIFEEFGWNVSIIYINPIQYPFLPTKPTTNLIRYRRHPFLHPLLPMRFLGRGQPSYLGSCA